MDIARIKRDPKKVALAQAILEAYNPESVEDMNDALFYKYIMLRK